MSGDLYIYGNTNYKEMIIDYDDTTKVDNITYLKHDMSLVNGTIKGCYEVSYYNENRAMELLDFLGLSHRYDHKPNELSGGEQQRVAVARALINNPDLIFADEPSGNLDSESAENLHNLFFKLRDQFGQTFIIVTHNQELADRKLTMVDGKITNN